MASRVGDRVALGELPPAIHVNKDTLASNREQTKAPEALFSGAIDALHESARVAAVTGRTPVALLAGHGLVDKRFVAIGAAHLSDEEIKILGTARATVCACPTTERNFGLATAAVDKLLAAGHVPVIYDLRPSPWHEAGTVDNDTGRRRGQYACDYLIPSRSMRYLMARNVMPRSFAAAVRL